MAREIPSPEKILQRVLVVAAVDGWSVTILAVLGSLVSLLLGDLSGALVGVFVFAAGFTELRGRRRLQRGDAAGVALLVRAQLLLLSVILVYCVSRLGSFDGETVMGNLTPELQAALAEAGVQRADILPLVRIAFYGTYGTVIIVSIVFQGGLAWYYRQRSAAVTAALAAPPPPLAPPAA
jgi:L-fucose mutarotase/ribose pyranase (RbsD/FucU family)